MVPVKKKVDRATFRKLNEPAGPALSGLAPREVQDRAFRFSFGNPTETASQRNSFLSVWQVFDG